MSFLGDIIGPVASYFGAKEQADAQRDTNRDNIESTREQMKFQERMSSTAHFREVADLKAAGLNPILAAGGSGSSTPAGASAVSQPVPSITGKVVSSAMDQMRFRKEMAEADSRINLNRETTSTKWAEGEYLHEQSKSVREGIEKAEAMNYLLQNRLRLERQFPRIGAFLDALNARNPLGGVFK